MKRDWKKRAALTACGLLGVWLLAGMLRTSSGLTEIANRLSYIQDTGSILQSDLNSLRSELEQTFKAENSRLESCAFDVEEVDFAAGTYRVRISLIPKEFADNTKISVYFGTGEYALERNGFTYEGSAELSLDESYAGNVTVLFATGSKKNTEVLADYAGYQLDFENVLSGALGKMPSYKDGILSVRDTLDYALDGDSGYSFSELQLLVEAGEEIVYEEELFAGEDSEEEQESGDGFSGNRTLSVQEGVDEGSAVRIYLRAVSGQGCVFEYELFFGVTAEGGGFEEAERYFTGAYSVYDRNGVNYFSDPDQSLR